MKYSQQIINNLLAEKFTQNELASILKVTQGYISQIKDGKKKLTKPIMKRLIKEFPDLDSKKLQEEIIITSLLDNDDLKESKPDGHVIPENEIIQKKAILIPVAGRAGLYNSFYSDTFMETLSTEIFDVKKDKYYSKHSLYFKIEVEGVSMDTGDRTGLCEGDWIYCRSLDRSIWKSKLHNHNWRFWVFFHNERGILIKSIKNQNVETGELLLESMNPDKNQFPDIEIKLAECTYICNVVRVVYEL